jgi:flagellar biosynthesis protein FliQ
MTNSFVPRLCLVVVLATAIAAPAAFAKNSSEITQFGHDIRIAEGQQASELTCFNCSVYVRGQVAGEITTFHGSVVLEGNGKIAGDVTTFLGDLRMDDGTQIAGDVTVMGGKIRRPPTAQIAGDVTAFEGTVWVYLMLLSPFLVLAGIVALVVWLVRRRRPAPVLARAA